MHFTFNAPSNITSQNDLISHVTNNSTSSEQSRIIKPYLGEDDVYWEIFDDKIILSIYVTIRGYFKIKLIGEAQFINSKINLSIKFPLSYLIAYLSIIFLGASGYRVGSGMRSSPPK